MQFPDLSPTGRARVYVLTVLGTLVCIGAAFAIDGYSFTTGEWRWGATPSNNLLIPLVLAPPFFFFLLSKMRELSIAHRELVTIASTDSLTSCLNRRAFSAMVEGYLEKVSDAESTREGALLVLDVDHFKRVNDKFGHDQGDEALKLVVQAIRDSVRETDLVGRLGGEEFGAFMPRLDKERADIVARRICANVHSISFCPSGEPHELSISIGGAFFDESPVTFAELYRKADRLLYEAKRSGRDRVAMDGFVPGLHSA